MSLPVAPHATALAGLTDAAPILEVRKVSKSFGAAHAVREVDLTVRKGEFLSLLGPSGCGKTTLMRMIAGFEEVSAGKIMISGQDVTHVAPYRRPVGMMFQNLALFPHLSVAQNVGYGLKVRKMPASEIAQETRRVLELVGLAGMEERSVHQLSGGQRQRVALARAVVVKPSLICLDEPLSALDLKLRRQMQVELKAIQRRLGTTFLFVTHDQDEAISMSDRIAVMNKGRVEQLGTARAIYEAPTSAFVARFVGDTNLLDARVEGGRMQLPELGVTRDAPQRSPDGANVAFSIRPEDVRVRPPGLDGAQGTILGCTYFGPALRYEINVRSLRILATVASRTGQDAPFGVGDPVTIDWAEGAGVIVNHEGSANFEGAASQ